MAWLYVVGEWPKEVDHVNRDKADNRWANFRLATRAQNGANRVVYKRDKSLPRGVTPSGDAGRFRARIAVGRKQRSLGTFATPDEAAAAYDAAAAEIYGDFLARR